MADRSRLGAFIDEGGTTFRLRSTAHRDWAVRLHDPAGDVVRTVPLGAEGDDLYAAHVAGVEHGARYRFVGDGVELGDPYARWLPEGVDRPAAVWREDYPWRHDALHRPLAGQVIYELHVGTFTPEGTYAAAAERLGYLAGLGVTSIEIMPVAAFAGRRGWGYDGVAHFAPHFAYGTPDQLKALIDAAHALRLAVLLDVVYNHFGPVGNVLPAYCPEVIKREQATGWGDGLDFGVTAVREYVLANVRMWLDEYRLDGLRLDAVHAIVDRSEPPILRELTDIAGERALMIAEDDRNDPALVERDHCDAIWADDFHHAVHVTLTGERDGYYAAYEPGAAEVARAIERGWIYEGQPFPIGDRPRGCPPDRLPAAAFVYCLQNHDQIGNRAFGDRLTDSISLDAYCAASMLLLFLPMTPLLFMGQEWAASSPFLYFTDHSPDLGAVVSAGRRAEFERFAAFRDPELREKIPDPQAEDSFARSVLRWQEQAEPDHARVLALTRTMLQLRAADPVLSTAGRDRLRAIADDRVLAVFRWTDTAARALFVNLSAEPATARPAGGKPMLASTPTLAFPELAPWSAVIVDGARYQP